MLFYSKEVEKASLTIKKTDTSGYGLSGAEFRVTGPNINSVVNTGTLGTAVVNNLKPNGTYTITEITPPNGYELSNIKTQTKTVVAGSNNSVTFSNPLSPYIEIIKKDADEGKVETSGDLSSAQFGIYSNQACTNLIATGYTSYENGICHIIRKKQNQNNNAKFYIGQHVYIKEIKAPEGYQLNNNVQHKTLVAGKNTFTFTNHQTPKIKIYKEDADNNDPNTNKVAGATFGIYSDSACRNKLTEATTKGMYGVAEVSEYTQNGQIKQFAIGGTYYVKEITPPNGYQPAAQNQQVQSIGPLVAGENVVRNNRPDNGTDQPNNVIFKNRKTPIIKIRKIDKESKAPLANAKFGIYEDEACTKRLTGGKTGADGILTKSQYEDERGNKYQFKIGATYYVKEEEAPNKYYQLDKKNVRKIGPLDPGENEKFNDEAHNNVTFENYKTPIIKIKKVDKEEPTKVLENAKFGIYSDPECTPEHRLTGGRTGADGILTKFQYEDKNGNIHQFKIGETYYVKEEEAPNKYYQLDKKYIREVGPLVPGENEAFNQNSPNNVTFKNYKTPIIKIKKVDKEEPTKVLENAKFGIYSDPECTPEHRLTGGRTGADGILTKFQYKDKNGNIHQFKIGETYYVKEEEAPNEYYQLDEDYIREVGPLVPGENEAFNKNSPNNVTFKNYKTPIIKIYKRDIDTNELQAGATFGIYSDEACTHRLTGGTTGKKGVYEVHNYKEGNEIKQFTIGAYYWIKEEKPPQDYATAKPKIQRIGKLKPGVNETKNEFTYKNKYMTLTIIKVDEYRPFHRVKGAEYKVYTDENLTNQVGKGTTDENGELSIKGVLFEGQTYYIKETKAPFGYELSTTIGKITLKEGSNIIKMTNPKKPDYIYKYAEETNKQYPVANVTIGYKNWTPNNPNYTHAPPDSAKPKDRSQYKTGEEYQRVEDAYNDWKNAYEHYVTSRNGKYVTTGVTDKNGRVEVDGNLLREDGTYEIWEIASGNKYFQIDQPVQKLDAHTLYIPHDPDAEKEIIENPRTHEDIEGWVWIEDVPKGEPNNLLAGDQGEKLVNGALVELKTKNGQLVRSKEGKEMSMVTGSLAGKGNGYYRFDLLEVSKIKADDYVIEITYNGLLYKSIPVKDLTARMPNVTRSSKLSDIPEKRAQLNTTYSTIDKNSKTLSGGNAVQYDTNTPYESTRICDKVYKGLSNEEAACTQTTTKGYNVTADTKTSQYKLIDSYNPLYDCITNVNLGLSKREEPNLVLEKDLQTVRITINGEEHIYQYGDKDKVLLEEFLKSGDIKQPKDKNDVASIYDLKPKVRMGEKYGSLSYTRALEASDIKYDSNNYGDVPEDKKLEITATYRIGICNLAEGYVMKVNGIVDYLDNKYDINTVQASRVANIDGSLDQNQRIPVDIQPGSGGYNAIRMQNLNIEVAPKTGGSIDQSIYISAKIKPEQLVQLVDDKNTNIVQMSNFAEITSYTTIDKATRQGVAGIDINSQPDNLKVEDKNTYEDDSNKAPDFKLVLQEPRKISGTVFIDKSTVNSNNIRQGDGIYNSDNEPGLKGVKIRVSINRYKASTGGKGTWEDAKMYTESGWKIAEGETDKYGNFTIGGLIPGDFKVEYEWGGQTYELNGNTEKVRVQDYKATVVNKEVHAKKELPENARIWYRDEFKKANGEWDTKTNKELRKSDAIDDYSMRQEIDKQDTVMTYHNKKVIEQYSGELEVENNVEATLLTKMKSRTPMFNIGIEYYESDKGSGTTPSEDEEYVKNNGNLKFENGIVLKDEKYQNCSKGFDFGIVERAKQKLGLHKELKSVESVAANGTILAEAKRNKTSEDMVTNNGLRYFKEEKGMVGSGVLEYEIDNEIEQSDKLSIQYEITITNVGEVEYLTEEFYNYGAGHGEDENQVVKLKAKSIIDYLDNQITTSLDINEEQWHICAQPDYNKEFNNSSDITKQLLSEEVITYMKQNYENVLSKENLEDIWLDPIKRKSVAIMLECSRLLTNTNEDVTFANDAEIIRALKTGGATLEATPGNYIPGKIQTSEIDNDTSELVTVISPTGLNKNYVAIGILGLSSLGILVCGIILIKKYVLK